jgi:hypothetical protein
VVADSHKSQLLGLAANVSRDNRSPRVLRTTDQTPLCPFSRGIERSFQAELDDNRTEDAGQVRGAISAGSKRIHQPCLESGLPKRSLDRPAPSPSAFARFPAVGSSKTLGEVVRFSEE